MNRKQNEAMFALLAWLLLLPGSVAALPQVPAVDAGLGLCSALFIINGVDGKPIYDAKISVVIRHGAMGLHKTELEAGTNSEGRARVTGLPERVKKPLEFRIAKGPLAKTILHDPSRKCEATFEVTLGPPEKIK